MNGGSGSVNHRQHRSDQLHSTSYSGASGETHTAPKPLSALLDPRWLHAFARHLWQHFHEDRCFEAAAGLAYTSLLALVPLMAVMLGVLSAFPVFDYGVEQLQDFIFSYFVPAVSDVVREYLDQFIACSTSLTGTGTIFLVIAAIILMAMIEKILNRIWRVSRPRRPIGRLTVYWAVLTLGPLLLGASLGLTSYLAALPLLAPEMVRGSLQSLLLIITPFLVALVAFTLIFMIVPNRQVHWRHALTGAACSALAFELSKRGFVFYLTNFPTYERLYGALAAIPIFLVWIYISWVIVLFGACVAASLTTFSYRPVGSRWNPRHYLLLIMRLLGHLRQAQRHGQGRSLSQLLERETEATDSEMHMLLAQLNRAGLLQRDAEGDWFLAADLDEVSLADLYRCMPLVLPMGELEDFSERNPVDRVLLQALHEIQTQSEPVLQRSLKSFLGPAVTDGEPMTKGDH